MVFSRECIVKDDPRTPPGVPEEEGVHGVCWVRRGGKKKSIKCAKKYLFFPILSKEARARCEKGQVDLTTFKATIHTNNDKNGQDSMVARHLPVCMIAGETTNLEQSFYGKFEPLKQRTS